jgi:hypothetical protein
MDHTDQAIKSIGCYIISNTHFDLEQKISEF